VPLGAVLKKAAETQGGEVVPGAGDDLHAEGKCLLIESAGQREHRNPREVEGTDETGGRAAD